MGTTNDPHFQLRDQDPSAIGFINRADMVQAIYELRARVILLERKEAETRARPRARERPAS